MVEKAAYQVLAIYKCNICKEDHQSGLVLLDLLPDPSARMAEMGDMKIQVYNSIKKIFANIHAPTDKFNPKRLTITETDNKGKSRKVKITDIEEFSKGRLTEIEKIEAKRGSGSETPEKPVAIDTKTIDEITASAALVKPPIEKEEETPFQDTGKEEGMSIDEIKKKVEMRIVELNKTTKKCREQMAGLNITIQETRAEIAKLQPLLKAINEPKKKGKNNGRKKSPKSKRLPSQRLSNDRYKEKRR